MKAFTKTKNSNGRSSSACGYCRQVGHSIRECPHIKFDHDEWQAHRVPHQSPTLQHNRWFMGDYTYWIKQINRYYPKWKAAQESIDKSTGRVVRSTRKCGFCGSTDHTRRQCPEMTRVYNKIVKANINYRQALYDRFVTDFGLGLAAMVKVQTGGGWRSEPKESIGTIVGFDLGDVNLFRSTDNYNLDQDYRGNVHIIVRLPDGQEHHLGLNEVRINNPRGSKDKWAERMWQYGRASYIETISRSTQPLDQEWVTNGADAFEWLLKKKSYEWLKARDMHNTITRWSK